MLTSTRTNAEPGMPARNLGRAFSPRHALEIAVQECAAVLTFKWSRIFQMNSSMSSAPLASSSNLVNSRLRS
jgi:hypothetical protein